MLTDLTNCRLNAFEGNRQVCQTDSPHATVGCCDGRVRVHKAPDMIGTRCPRIGVGLSEDLSPPLPLRRGKFPSLRDPVLPRRPPTGR